MRNRLFTLAGALTLAVGGLVAVAASPAAAASHCTGFGTHPDLYNSGGISFQNGTNIRTQPYTDCTSVGEGFPSQGINVHCAEPNANGLLWIYLVDTSTGTQGWSRADALNYSKTVLIPDCRNATAAISVG